MYTDYITRGQLVEAHAGLSGLPRAHGAVLPGQPHLRRRGAGQLRRGRARPTSNYFTYNCVPAGQTYIATATGSSRPGRRASSSRSTSTNVRARPPPRRRLGPGGDGALLGHEERLLLMRRAAQSGFSLIEILVAIAILATRDRAGLPSYMTWIQNTQIRTAVGGDPRRAADRRRTRPSGATPRSSSSSSTARTSQWRVNFFTIPTATRRSSAARRRKARPTPRSRSLRAAPTR